ncbi:hypothetical protein FKM82_005713 [Ascaphus truei]
MHLSHIFRHLYHVVRYVKRKSLKWKLFTFCTISYIFSVRNLSSWGTGGKNHIYFFFKDLKTYQNLTRLICPSFVF